MRLVFAGTPETAVPALEKLLVSRHEVAAVLTRADAPSGRGRRLVPSPVAARAREAGLEVLTPAQARDPDFLGRLREIGPDCCPVVAYGALLPREALEIPRHGWVNLHFSLLPAWRGAAPVQHAILHGDDITGATTFRIVEALDAGPVYGVVTEPIRRTDTAGDLLRRLAGSGAELLAATLDGIESGELQARPQPAEGVSIAPKLAPDDARVNWTLPAHAVDRLIRACTPAPGAWTTFAGTRLKLGPVTLGSTASSCADRAGADGASADGGGTGSGGAGSGGAGRGGSDRPRAASGCLRPGQLLVDHRRVLVGTATTAVELGEVQAQGKRRMPAADWARGLRLTGGERLV